MSGERNCKPLIEARDLYINFYTYAGVVKAIDGVSFKICRGETYCLVGETGCGKSVTAKALTGLIRPPGRIEKGRVIYYGLNGEPVDLLGLSEEELRKIRGSEISYVFQDPSASLDPLYTLGYQLSETLLEHGIISRIKEGFERAVESFKRVMMPDAEVRVKSYPHELSGGMKQRGVIGIGLSSEPKLLIADEPTTALDATVQDQIMDLLKELKKNRNLTILLITHNMGLVADMCDRVAVMYAGRIVEEASVYELFQNPKHPYTKALLRAVPNPVKRMDELESIPGTVPNLIYPPPGCRFHPRCPEVMEVCKKERPPEVYVAPGHRVACWLYADRKREGGEE